MEKKNQKLALMSSITITLSVLLMNVGRLEGIVPDNVIRIIGVITMIATGVSVFLTVRALAGRSKENKSEGKE